MKIRLKEYDVVEADVSIQEYVERELDGDDYERGSAEACRATADKTARALGRLLELLAGRKFITGEDVVEITEGGSDYDSVELIDDKIDRRPGKP